MNWYCVHTRPQKEIATSRYLSEIAGLTTYFPRLQQRKVIRRVKQLRIVPLFPRYLFCRLALADHYRLVNYAPEVLGFVSRGGHPVPVDDDVIGELQGWAGATTDIISITPAFSPGDAIRITQGPMQGLEGVFLHEMSDGERVAILLSIVDSSASVILNRHHFQKAM